MRHDELNAIRERCKQYRTEEQFDGVYIEVYLADVEKLIENIEQLTAENRILRNELCMKCERYRHEYKGYCDGCRWHKHV